MVRPAGRFGLFATMVPTGKKKPVADILAQSLTIKLGNYIEPSARNPEEKRCHKDRSHHKALPVKKAIQLEISQRNFERRPDSESFQKRAMPLLDVAADPEESVTQRRRERYRLTLLAVEVFCAAGFLAHYQSARSSFVRRRFGPVANISTRPRKSGWAGGIFVSAERSFVASAIAECIMLRSAKVTGAFSAIR